MTEQNHTEPITGVLNSNAPEWLYEDIINGIDLDYDQYKKDNPDDEYGDNYEGSDSTYLIGFIKNDKDEYELDKTAEYSAIVGQVYTQVVMSKYVSKCSFCSICYPNQGDLDTEGVLMTYTLPLEVWGESEHLEIIKLPDVIRETRETIKGLKDRQILHETIERRALADVGFGRDNSRINPLKKVGL